VTTSKGWRSVGAALNFGAAYDLFFGIAILTIPRLLGSWLHLEVPADPVYLYLNGVFLLLLAGIYAAAARQPDRYPAIAPIAAGGRLIGCGFFLWAWAGGRPAAFFGLALGDLAIGVATFLAWRRDVAYVSAPR
jgi:hypothetical protein